MQLKQIEKKFFYSRFTRVAAIAVLVAYFCYVTIDLASQPGSLGMLTMQFGALAISFPPATIVSLLVATCLMLALRDFITMYYKTVDRKKVKANCSMTPELLMAGIVACSAWGSFYLANHVMMSQQGGFVKLSVLSSLPISVPVAVPLAFFFGIGVFVITSFFYKSIEEMTPKKNNGRIISEMLLTQ